MPRFLRGGFVALALCLSFVSVSPAAAQTTVPAADAAKFMGVWALTFEVFRIVSVVVAAVRLASF